MTQLVHAGTYGVLTEPTTLKIERLLPGPIERVWSYLTDSDLRSQWLAAGQMELQADAPFEFHWRNDDLTIPPGQKPAGATAEHHMQSRITEVDPPRKLVINWGGAGTVSFELEPRGSKVLLTLIHRGLPDRATLLNVSAGWHTHLDILVARASGEKPLPFWDRWVELKADYDRRLPA